MTLGELRNYLDVLDLPAETPVQLHLTELNGGFWLHAVRGNEREVRLISEETKGMWPDEPLI